MHSLELILYSIFLRESLSFSYYPHMALCNERKKKINKIHCSLKAKELWFPILRHLANLIFLQMLLDIN